MSHPTPTSDDPEGQRPDDEAASDDEPQGGFFLNVVPALLYVGAVFYGHAASAANMPNPDIRFGDKLMHALAFFGMQITLYRALRYLSTSWPSTRVNAVTLGLTIAVGGALELYQAALPHRSAEWLDWAADIAGALLGAWVVRWRSRP